MEYQIGDPGKSEAGERNQARLTALLNSLADVT